MNDLVLAAARVQTAFALEKWRFCFIGGLAVQHWGEPRFTRDLDLSLMTGLGSEEKFLNRLIQLLPPREPDPIEFAKIARVYLGLEAEGTPVDVSLAGDQFEERVLNRAVEAEYAKGIHLRVCCAEDLVTYKAFAGRPVDWQDIEGILLRRKGKLDWNIIEAELVPLLELKEDPDAFGMLMDLRKKTKP